MKRIFLIIATIFTFVACDEKGNLDPDLFNAFDAKWILESGDYSSFEFNDTGDYIVVCNSDSNDDQLSSSPRFIATKSSLPQVVSRVVVGDYEFDGDKAVVMEGFGRVELISADSESVSFSLKLEGETESVNYTASVAEVVASSDITSMLCRKWDVIKVVEDGVEVSFEDDDAKNVLFSKAGTYLIERYDGTTRLAQWKWKSEEDKTMYFTWDGEWREECSVTFTTLSWSSLVVEQKYGDGSIEVTTLAPTKL